MKGLSVISEYPCSIKSLVVMSLEDFEYQELAYYEPLLADTTRVETYREWMEKHLEPSDVVLDVGTGTGVLAHLAAQHADTVYGIDKNEHMIPIAEYIAAENNLTNTHFKHTHTKNYTPEEPIDVVIHETMGTGIFEERMVKTLTEIKNHDEIDDVAFVPNDFELFVEPVELPEGQRIPFLWNIDIDGIDMSCLVDFKELHENTQQPRSSLFYLHEVDLEQYLSSPEPLYSFSIDDITTPDDIPDKISTSRKITSSGQLDGFAVYFKAHLDDELTLTSKPESTSHWSGQMILTEPCNVTPGDTLTYTVKIHDQHQRNWVISYDTMDN